MPAQVSPWIAFSTQLKYSCGTSLASHSPSLLANSVFMSAKFNAPPRFQRWFNMSVGVWFKNPRILSSISSKYSWSTASKIMSLVACMTP